MTSERHWAHHPAEEPPEPEPASPDGDEEHDDDDRGLSFWQELPILVLVALVLAVLVKTFLFQAFYIPSGSMLDTLEVNDRVLVNKVSYAVGDVERRQVVVFDQRTGPQPDEPLPEKLLRNLAESVGLATPEADLIKRVIGLPGETVEARDNQVFIDGVAIAEPYLSDLTITEDFGPVTVPEGEYFVMGDNRGSSQDSRVIGTISHDRLIGRAFVIIWPPSSWSGL